MIKKSNAPRKRSRLYFWIAQNGFVLKRHIQWLLRKDYVKAQENQSLLEHKIVNHKSILLRKLKNVDMWLQYNKIRNLKIAAGKISGIILKPGEVFSFWRLVGKPTKKKGYLPGMVLHNGSFHPGVGGGLCQMTNLIYWMTLHTPLTVIERYRHNYDVFPDSNRTLPFGSGATISYNYIDLQIQNNTEDEYQLIVKVGDEYLEGEWRSIKPKEYTYEVYESEHKIIHEWWGGYIRHNILRRKVFDLCGKLIDDEFITENNAIMMYEPLLKA